MCLFVSALLVLAGCGRSDAHLLTRSEFLTATMNSGLGPLNVLDNRAALAKLTRSLQHSEPARGRKDDTVVVSRDARDPRSALLYAVRFADSATAQKAEASYGREPDVRVCNVVLMSSAPAGSVERRRFDSLVSILRQRC